MAGRQRPRRTTAQRVRGAVRHARRGLARIDGTAWSVAGGPRTVLRQVARLSRPDPLAPYLDQLPDSAPRVVVALLDDASRRGPARWLSPFAGDRLHVVLGAADPPPRRSAAIVHRVADIGETMDALVSMPPVDVILDLRSVGATPPRMQVWKQLFLFLRPGGTYIVGRVRGRADLDVSERAWLAVVASDLVPQRTEWHLLECVRAVSSVVRSRNVLIFHKRLRHRAKLRSDTALEVLGRRDPDVVTNELVILPSLTFESRVSVVEHPARAVEVVAGRAGAAPRKVTLTEAAETVRPNMASRFDVPSMHVQHFAGDIVFAGQTLMYTPNSILPDSFRFQHGEYQINPYLHNSAGRAVRVQEVAQSQGSLAGTYYQLDPQYSGHFGHIMTEVVGRLWGWDEAKARYPDLKAIFRPRPGNRRNPIVERTLLNGWGIAEDDIAMIDEPVTVDSLVSATVMWHNHPPRYVHPHLADVWQRLASRVIDPAAPAYDRIFVSRSDGFARRICRNREAVEDFFAQRGFTVIHPERYPIPVQAGIFARASVIAGFGGSAMFSMMYAQNMSTLIVLSHDSYWARNEHMFSAVLGGTAHYFWSSPRVLPPPGGWTPASSSSDWEFDFGWHEAALDELLASL